ncbi:hypothetical protein OH76DRAFT_203385 [Lentinus brumalis]|uniref:Uncharacterized protein n=1 Tax=Lentinus brumalis TaxID=2498619 RepID=A0A371DIB0_9APHY|nr:hypothetical protein OH76DRAFT_203385 [Polyporus brumalis]
MEYGCGNAWSDPAQADQRSTFNVQRWLERWMLRARHPTPGPRPPADVSRRTFCPGTLDALAVRDALGASTECPINVALRSTHGLRMSVCSRVESRDVLCTHRQSPDRLLPASCFLLTLRLSTVRIPSIVVPALDSRGQASGFSRTFYGRHAGPDSSNMAFGTLIPEPGVGAVPGPTASQSSSLLRPCPHARPPPVPAPWLSSRVHTRECSPSRSSLAGRRYPESDATRSTVTRQRCRS